MRGLTAERAANAALPIVNLLAAFAITSLVLLAIGEDPIEAIAIMIWGAFGFGEAIGYTLYYTTSFIFTGLAFALAFQAGLFNIGGEGQAYIGGLGVALVCLHADFLPLVLLIPLAILAAAAFGAGWAFVPAWLQARRGSHVVITTIMFNFIASSLIVYLLVNLMSPAGSMQPETRTFVETARLPFVHDLLSSAGITIASSPLNLSFVWALICCVAVWVLVWRTRLGYELRTVGLNPRAAHYAGISIGRMTIIAMALSGALAGFMALNEIMGVQHRLLLEFTAGYGFVGIAVALMGRSHPLGIIFAALLFGALYQGGAELAFERPAITRDMIIVIQGLVILFAGALEHMFSARLRALAARIAARAKPGMA
ncbi:MAG: ABC transporter permease [Rhizobiales bacterium]|nr:ABC transporter permease [Hyphomicrobiales bacterium]